MLKYIGALILVEDVAKARHFYETLLGQTVKDDFVEDIAFEGGLSIHRKAHFEQLLGGAKATPAQARPHWGELYFETDEIEALEPRLRAAGVAFAHPLLEQPWGQLAMRLYDPDGHLLEIGEPMDMMVLRLQRGGFSADDICRKSGLAKAFVEAVIAG